MRALEEQAYSIGGTANSMLQAVNTFKNSAEFIKRTVENLKKDDRDDPKGYEFSSWRSCVGEGRDQKGDVVAESV